MFNHDFLSTTDNCAELIHTSRVSCGEMLMDNEGLLSEIENLWVKTQISSLLRSLNNKEIRKAERNVPWIIYKTRLNSLFRWAWGTRISIGAPTSQIHTHDEFFAFSGIFLYQSSVSWFPNLTWNADMGVDEREKVNFNENHFAEWLKVNRTQELINALIN